MKKLFVIISISMVSAAAPGQTMSMNDCMRYAAEHAPAVRQARWDLASAGVNQTEAIADFFPSVEAQTGAQFSWGRNIDPETNTYNNVTTLNNGYGIYASMTLFDGGRTFNSYKRARTERERALSAVEMQRDDRAIATMMAYVDAVYYLKSIAIADERLRQSQGMLALTLRQEELGIKSHPDVAQARATVADNEYRLVHQQNLYTQAMQTLRTTMNLPYGEALEVDTTAITAYELITETDNAEAIYRAAVGYNPRALNAEMSVKSSQYQYRMAKGALSPSISLNAGISTSFYKTLNGNGTVPGFGEQFRNNRGEYISATLSIPLFSNLSRTSSVKRARFALEKARDQRDEELRRLHDDIVSAVVDRDGYAAEIQALQTKVGADREAYNLSRRKYEEGLMSLIDLQIYANTYFESALSLLQRQMLYILKNKLVDYYKGGTLWT